jgi:xanthine dehydrogenase iron-sulfur cluster and FAD-binding subunit A
VNGVRHDLNLEPRVTLLDTLRERLNLCGTKKGCDIGQCGACTVHIDGHLVLSCLTLAVQAVAAALVELFATASSAKSAVAVDALRRLRNGGRTVPSVSHNLTPANLGQFVTARPVARAPTDPEREQYRRLADIDFSNRD